MNRGEFKRPINGQHILFREDQLANPLPMRSQLPLRAHAGHILDRRVAGCATPTGSAGHPGATANLKLTFHLDHSGGLINRRLPFLSLKINPILYQVAHRVTIEAFLAMHLVRPVALLLIELAGDSVTLLRVVLRLRWLPCPAAPAGDCVGA
jgi:hypothetical protein